MAAESESIYDKGHVHQCENLFYRNIQINGNVFLRINIHYCLYITEYTLFNKTLNIYACVKISDLCRSIGDSIL